MRPPLWARWAISLVVAAVLVVLLVRFVGHHNGNALAHQNAAAVQQEDRQAQIVVGQDQAPKTVTIAAGSTTRAALVSAVRGEMRHRVATGNVAGQLRSVSCRQTGRRAGRLAFRCTAVAGHVRYPFLAVATPLDAPHRLLQARPAAGPDREHPGQPPLPA